MKDALIIVFSKVLNKGQVKRRLARDVGDQAALEIYAKLFSQTLEIVKSSGLDSKLYLSESPTVDFPIPYSLQEGGDLGERMSIAIASELKSYRKVCLIGSDCLDLKAEDLVRAIRLLQSKELVLGPSLDGGYYLIGMRKIAKKLFEKIPWGTATVLAETLKIARELEIDFDLLDKRRDVDTVEDLPEGWLAE